MPNKRDSLALFDDIRSENLFSDRLLVNGLPQANDLDAFLPQPSEPIQYLGQRPAQAVQRRHLHTVARLEGGLQTIQPRPVPREAPLPTSSKTCSHSASTRRCVLRLLASASLATDTLAYP